MINCMSGNEGCRNRIHGISEALEFSLIVDSFDNSVNHPESFNSVSFELILSTRIIYLNSKKFPIYPCSNSDLTKSGL